MRVLVVGGTGTIGKALLPRLVGEGHEVVATSRDPDRRAWPAGVTPIAWRPPDPVPAAIGKVDAVVNLAGEGIMDRRWTEKRKRQLVDSRLHLTGQLVDWAGRQPGRPALVNANAVGYYGILPSGPCPESRGPGDDFLARLCVDWQAAAERHKGRVAVLRFGHVLSAEGGYLGKMLPLLKVGLAGKLGNGRQPMPWVHVDDVAGVIAWAVATPKARGAYNVTAPESIDQAAFTQAALAAVGKRWAPPVPALAMRVRFGEAAAPILGGQDAPPARLVAEGFRFRHTAIGPAVRHLLAA